MTELLLSTIILITGAIGGLVRTLHQHEGRLIWPFIDFRKWKIRLGFPFSMLIGAVVAWFAEAGVITAIPAITPDDPYKAVLFGLVIGFISLDLINRLLGIKFETPEKMEFGGRFTPHDEKNIHLREMYQIIDKEASEFVERVKISSGQTPGILRVIVVPKKGVEVIKAKMVVENTINRIAYPSTQIYVKTPEEVLINMSIVVEIMNGDNPELTKTEFSKKITRVLRNHIDSLQPGEPVYRSQIVHKVVGLDKYIKDVRGEKLTTIPPMVEGRIPIGSFQVARSGNIDVKIVIRTIGSS